MTIRSLLLAATACCVASATTASAETVSNRNMVDLLAPFTRLTNSDAGRAALTDNLERTIAINRNSTAAERSQARSDNAIIANGSQFTMGLGTTLDARYRQALTVPAFAARTNAATSAAAQFTTFVGNDSSFGKMYFANGTGATPTVPLPAGGHFDIYDIAYGKPASNADPYGNPRPFQTAANRIDWFAGDLLTAYNWSPAFPSGHAAFGTTTALLQAMAVPERFSQEIARGLDYGYSRVVLGAHYVADVVASRALAYQDVANMLNGVTGYTSSNFAATFETFRSNFRAVLGSDAEIAAAAVNDSGRFADLATVRAQAADRLTYGVTATGATDLAAVVPAGAEVLLKTRFGYLTDDQRRTVLATTEIASGGFLDNGSGWARLDLVRAGGGYGAFDTMVTIRQDASAGAAGSRDRFTNDIGGSGGLIHRGNGTLFLAGTNSYAGGTTIAEGILVAASARALGTGAVTLEGGELMIGSAGLMLDGAFTMIGGTLHITDPGTPFAIGGRTMLGGDLLVDLAGLGSIPGEYRLMRLSDVAGTFATTRFAGLAQGYAAQIGYRADGVYLSVAAIPEPATWALMLAGFALSGVALRRRRPTALSAV